MHYYANGFNYKFEQEKDGWWSIYRLHEATMKYIPVIQAKDLAHAESYCDLCEAVTVPMERIG